MGRILLPIDPAGMGYQRQNHDYVSTYQSPWAQVGPHVLVNTAIPLAGQALNAGITSAANAYNKSEFEANQRGINDAADRAPADLAAMRGGQPGGRQDAAPMERSPRAAAASAFGGEPSPVAGYGGIERGEYAQSPHMQERQMQPSAPPDPSDYEAWDAYQRANGRPDWNGASRLATQPPTPRVPVVAPGYGAMGSGPSAPEAGNYFGVQPREAQPGDLPAERPGGMDSLWPEGAPAVNDVTMNHGVIDPETGEPMQLAAGGPFGALLKRGRTVMKAVQRGARAQAAHEAASAAPAAVRQNAVKTAMDQAGHELQREYVPTPRAPTTKPPSLPNTGVAPQPSPQLDAAYTARRAAAEEMSRASAQNPLNAGAGDIDVNGLVPGTKPTPQGRSVPAPQLLGPKNFEPDLRSGVEVPRGSALPTGAAGHAQDISDWATAVRQGEATLGGQAQMLAKKAQLAAAVREEWDALTSRRLLGNPTEASAAKAVMAGNPSPAQMAVVATRLKTLGQIKKLGAAAAAIVGTGAAVSALSAGDTPAGGAAGRGVSGEVPSGTPTLGTADHPPDIDFSALAARAKAMAAEPGDASAPTAAASSHIGKPATHATARAESASEWVDRNTPDVAAPPPNEVRTVAAPGTPEAEQASGMPHAQPRQLLDPRKLHSYQQIMNAAALAQTPEEKAQVLAAAERSGLQDAPAESWLDVINPQERTNRGFETVRSHMRAKAADPLAEIRAQNYASEIAHREELNRASREGSAARVAGGAIKQAQAQYEPAKQEATVGMEQARRTKLEIDNETERALRSAGLQEGQAKALIAAQDARDRGDMNSAKMLMERSLAGKSIQEAKQIIELMPGRKDLLRAQTGYYDRWEPSSVNIGAREKVENRKSSEAAFRKAWDQNQLVQGALAAVKDMKPIDAIAWFSEDPVKRGGALKALGLKDVADQATVDAFKRKAPGVAASLERERAIIESAGGSVDDKGVIHWPTE